MSKCSVRWMCQSKRCPVILFFPKPKPCAHPIHGANRLSTKRVSINRRPIILGVWLSEHAFHISDSVSLFFHTSHLSFGVTNASLVETRLYTFSLLTRFISNISQIIVRAVISIYQIPVFALVMRGNLTRKF